MEGQGDLDVAKLRLDRDRLRFERQKFAIETRAQRRDRSGQRHILKDLLINPIALAVVGGFVTLMTGIATTAYTAAQNREAEALRASYSRDSAREAFQADLIKKFVEGPSPEAVRGNLKFLIDAGLVPAYAKDISSYLAKNPEAAPQVGAERGRDDAVPTASLATSDPLQLPSRSVGQLVSRDRGYSCTAFLVGPDLIASAGHCVFDTGMEFALGDARIPVTLVARKDSSGTRPSEASYALLRLSKHPAVEVLPLKLSSVPPPTGIRLAILLFRGSQTQLTVRSPNCVAGQVGKETFEHACTTGSGSSGAPVISLDTAEVVGLHSTRRMLATGEGLGGWATRADIVATAVKAAE